MRYLDFLISGGSVVFPISNGYASGANKITVTFGSLPADFGTINGVGTWGHLSAADPNDLTANGGNHRWPQTTLAPGIDSATTSIAVADGSVFHTKTTPCGNLE